MVQHIGGQREGELGGESPENFTRKSVGREGEEHY